MKETLIDIFDSIRHRNTMGVDGITVQKYEDILEQELEIIERKVNNGTYDYNRHRIIEKCWKKVDLWSTIRRVWEDEERLNRHWTYIILYIKYFIFYTLPNNILIISNASSKLPTLPFEVGLSQAPPSKI